jgi:hypothetical protein
VDKRGSENSTQTQTRVSIFKSCFLLFLSSVRQWWLLSFSTNHTSRIFYFHYLDPQFQHYYSIYFLVLCFDYFLSVYNFSSETLLYCSNLQPYNQIIIMKKGNLGLGLKLSLPQTDQVAFAKFLWVSFFPFLWMWLFEFGFW